MLKAAGKSDYALEAALLLEHAAGLTRAERILRENEPLPAQADTIYQRFLSERENGRPLQYIRVFTYSSQIIHKILMKKKLDERMQTILPFFDSLFTIRFF